MSTKIRGATGRYKNATHTEADVAATSTLVLAENNLAQHRMFMNNTSDDIYLMCGAAAELNKGILLAGTKGFSYEMSERLGNLYKGAIYGIHGGSGTKRVLVLEGT